MELILIKKNYVNVICILINRLAYTVVISSDIWAKYINHICQLLTIGFVAWVSYDIEYVIMYPLSLQMINEAFGVFKN